MSLFKSSRRPSGSGDLFAPAVPNRASDSSRQPQHPAVQRPASGGYKDHVNQGLESKARQTFF